MPYLTKENKEQVEKCLTEADSLEQFGNFLVNSGELNYSLTKIVLGYFKARGGRYSQINDVVGALESCKAEFQRRVVGPYEDSKVISNGEVY